MTNCRRRAFAEAFGSVAGFKRCGNMCDNCLAANGVPRESFRSNSDKTTQKRKAVVIEDNTINLTAAPKTKFVTAKWLSTHERKIT